MVENLKSTSGLDKPYANLTKDETIAIINKELGDCYVKIINSITSEWEQLNSALRSVDTSLVFNNPVQYPLLASKKVIPVFNPMTNFAEVNAVYGNDSRRALEEVLRVYQNIVRGKDLEIKDEVSFQGSKTLSFNRTLISLTNRFNPEYFTRAGLNVEEVFGKLTNSEDFGGLKR